MRSDMAKKLVERPRMGRWAPNWTAKHDRRSQAWDQLPKRRGMQPRHGDRKMLNENLAPLLRFLRARCGQPWDAVYQELRAGLDVRSPIQLHIFEHLFDYVAVHARWHDGVLYDVGRRWGGWLRVRRNGRQFYVDPNTGILKEPPDLRFKPPPEAPHRRLIDGRMYVRFRTVWYAIKTEALPLRWGWRGAVTYDRTATRRDVLFKTDASPQNEADRLALYGNAALYAVWKQPLNRRQLKRLGLWRI